LRRPRPAAALAATVVAVALSSAPAAAHQVTYSAVNAELGVLDLQGFTWTVEVKARVLCSGAEKSNIDITFAQVRQYRRMPGGAAVVLAPPANAYATQKVFLPPGQYEVSAPAVACNSEQPEPEGHTGDHGAGAQAVPIGRLDLPPCRRPVTAGGARFAPVVPVVREGTKQQAICPARPCEGAVVGSRVVPLVPVLGGRAVPAPCPTVEVQRRGVPLDVVCGPGAIASVVAPLLPVPGRPCRGVVELVSSSAGVAEASASRVIGRKRFNVRPGRHVAVKVPLHPGARTLLSRTRVLRMRAVVRSKGTRRKSKPFTVVKRG
jgi:hypothetical protein